MGTRATGSIRRAASLARRRISTAARALANARDLSELDSLRQAVEGTEVQYMRVITTLIRRHYPGAAVPPPELRMHVGANDSLLNFWAKGISSSELVLEAFGDEPAGPVLDWGCGSGRTLFWLRAFPGWTTSYHGTDVDHAAIDFLEKNGERAFLCGDDPPLPFDDGSFAGLFSFSVLTHIPAEKHGAWYEEVRRLLAPGGLALITTDSRTSDVSAASAAELAEQGSVFVPGPGHYKHAARVTETFSRAAIGDALTVEEFRPGGYLGQDVIFARRPMV